MSNVHVQRCERDLARYNSCTQRAAAAWKSAVERYDKCTQKSFWNTNSQHVWSIKCDDELLFVNHWRGSKTSFGTDSRQLHDTTKCIQNWRALFISSTQKYIFFTIVKCSENVIIETSLIELRFFEMEIFYSFWKLSHFKVSRHSFSFSMKSNKTHPFLLFSCRGRNNSE